MRSRKYSAYSDAYRVEQKSERKESRWQKLPEQTAVTKVLYVPRRKEKKKRYIQTIHAHAAAAKNINNAADGISNSNYSVMTSEILRISSLRLNAVYRRYKTVFCK